MTLKRFLPGPIFRLALGTLSLFLCLLLALDSVVGLVPDRLDTAVRIRQRISESLAIQVTSLLQTNDISVLGNALGEVLERDEEMLSVAVRRTDDVLVAVAGDHAQHWTLPKAVGSSITQVRVPMKANGVSWGDVEIAFRPVMPQSLGGWLADPIVRGVLLIAVLGPLVVYLYLRRALQYLDPGSAVPQRVRAAFDTLDEAVMLLDSDHRVVLVNRAFGHLHPAAAEDITGKSAEKIGWFTAGLRGDPANYPWHLVRARREAVQGIAMELPQPDGKAALRLLLNAAPIGDEAGRQRGCILSLSDVTALHLINAQLLETVGALDASNEKIREQNQALELLATRDPLTGCLNRRAFFSKLEERVTECRGNDMNLSCIMTDIDFFKRFNDTYGHAVGDQVLTAVASTLMRNMRSQDVLCRYGGEEFCIVLPGMDLAEAASVAERLRANVEDLAGSALRTTNRMVVTSSFGVAEWRPDLEGGADLINRADKALYEAKRNGRNQVACDGVQVVH